MTFRLGAGAVPATWPCTASDLDEAAAWIYAMRRGDWVAFGKAYEDLGQLLRSPPAR